MTKEERYDMENLVVEECCNMETMDEDEFEEKYNSLTLKYWRQDDEASLEFADNADGSKNWRSNWQLVKNVLLLKDFAETAFTNPEK